MARFDWYQATIPADAGQVIEALKGLSEAPTIKHARGMHGYAFESILSDSDGPVARVWHGGTHEHPHAVISGEMSQPGAELIRLNFPEHKVSRCDVCEDFAEPVFDPIMSAMLEAAAAHRVKVDTRGDHLLTKQGRTVYLGSAKSPCRMRLYDKAAELRARFSKDPAKLASVPEHLVRLEAQVRPAGEKAKRAFATIEPVNVMGSAAWQRHVWRLVTGLEVEPVEVRKPWRQADDERAYAYMLAQYGAVLGRMFETHGSWDCVGLQIGHDLAERAEADRRIRRC